MDVKKKQKSLLDSVLEVPKTPARIPLADRMRPLSLDEFYGQEHILGEGKPLRRMIESGNLCSMIFWGPPGCGKTTLAHIINHVLDTHFISFSAVLSGIKEVRAAMSDAAYFFEKTGSRSIIFIDEIHRFNKAQQDAFLPFVEKGQILLIGTTTVNPSFDLTPALMSRMKVFRLKGLDVVDIENVLQRALNDEEKGVNHLKRYLTSDTIHKIAFFSSGDARRALNLLEEISIYVEDKIKSGHQAVISQGELEDVLQHKTLLYDKDGEHHYNMLSALHKSMRNSDVDATVYWVVRMLESGEDARNICRRIIQCASEDVGLADKDALSIAVDAWHAYEMLGLPEGRLAILEAAVYVALAPKSNSLLIAMKKASEDVRNTYQEAVPLHLRNAPTNLMEEQGYGKGYLYAHDYPEKTTDMTCLPDSLVGHRYYVPSLSGLEARIRKKMEEIKKRREHFSYRKCNENENND